MDRSTFTPGKKEWALFNRDVVDGSVLLVCTARLLLERRVGGCLT